MEVVIHVNLSHGKCILDSLENIILRNKHVTQVFSVAVFNVAWFGEHLVFARHSIGDALETYWGRTWDALGTYWGLIGDVLGTH